MKLASQPPRTGAAGSELPQTWPEGSWAAAGSSGARAGAGASGECLSPTGRWSGEWIRASFVSPRRRQPRAPSAPRPPRRVRSSFRFGEECAGKAPSWPSPRFPLSAQVQRRLHFLGCQDRGAIPAPEPGFCRKRRLNLGSENRGSLLTVCGYVGSRSLVSGNNHYILE